ncbi:MAG TPA: VTT domain-containing protein [Galbitalea sp.]
MHNVTDFLLLMAASPWSYVVLAVLLIVDGFFPFVPGETLVVAMSVLSTTDHGPNLWIVLVTAIVSTTIGDAVAFVVGRRIGLTRWRWMRRPRIAKAFAWAGRSLNRRPAMLMLTAKFVPVGRVAVTMTAGATRFPVRRYIALAATASIIYTSYHVVVGFMAGTWLASNPVLGILAAIACVIVLGFLIDVGIRLVARSADRRSRRLGSADQLRAW